MAIWESLRDSCADLRTGSAFLDRSRIANKLPTDRNKGPIAGGNVRLVVLDAGDLAKPDGAAEERLITRPAGLAAGASLAKAAACPPLLVSRVLGAGRAPELPRRARR